MLEADGSGQVNVAAVKVSALNVTAGGRLRKMDLGIGFQSGVKGLALKDERRDLPVQSLHFFFGTVRMFSGFPEVLLIDGLSGIGVIKAGGSGTGMFFLTGVAGIREAVQPAAFGEMASMIVQNILSGMMNGTGLEFPVDGGGISGQTVCRLGQSDPRLVLDEILQFDTISQCQMSVHKDILLSCRTRTSRVNRTYNRMKRTARMQTSG